MLPPSAGVHPKVVSESLGHASNAITLDTYSHILPGLQAAAAAQLDAVLDDAANGGYRATPCEQSVSRRLTGPAWHNAGRPDLHAQIGGGR